MEIKTIKGKSLLEAINELLEDQYFKLGNIDGSSFIFCGKKEDFFEQKEHLEEKFHKSNHKALYKLDKQTKELSSKISELLTRLVTYQDALSRAIEVKESNLCEMKVKKASPSDDVTETKEEYKKAIIILTDGFCDGKYWTCSEAEEDRENERKRHEVPEH